ncbi:MAG TPA: hypothetical protein VEH56_03510 [Candidatus Saccharimonadales bacterium]|nr:hypothetical protein [Candidatus Saccharimonadales bacterium]
MTLVIKPVRLNKSVYLRIPNDIADLIGLSKTDEFTLRFQDTEVEVNLVYSLRKTTVDKMVQKTTKPILTTAN